MSTTLSYGYVRPQTGDTGSTFWTNLENDITQLNAHTHNGVDSAVLTSTSITPVSGTISAASWVLTSGGTYRQLVTTPPSITFDSYGLHFIITNGTDIGCVIHPTIVKVSNTTYWVYTNDNTINLSVLYLV